VLYPVSEEDNGFGDISDIASNAPDLFRKFWNIDFQKIHFARQQG
jgi:hypothetical protein